MALVWIALLLLTGVQCASGSIVNVARRKPVEVSSRYKDRDPNIAVDGNSSYPVDPTGVMHTDANQEFAWWTVDLERTVHDPTVRIYFRTDYKKRRNGVKFFTSTTPFSTYSEGQLCHTFEGNKYGTDISNISSVTCSGTWRYFLVYTDTNNDKQGPILDFGEIEVLACPINTFGPNCLPCGDRRCKDMTDCSGNGTCSGECQDGWTLDNCTQVCPSGTYGPSCSSFCGNCSGDDICDHETGNCPGDCKPGWREILCKQDNAGCQHGMYGANCQQKCGHCNDTCDVVSGHCPAGCESGFSGTTCETQIETAPPGTLSADPNIVPVVAGIVTAVLVIIIVVVFAIVMCRQRRGSTNTQNYSAGSQSQAFVDGNVCANVAMVSDEEQKTNRKPAKREKPAVREKTKQILQASKPQSMVLSHPDPDSEEEIVDEEQPASNRDYYNFDDTIAIREIPVGELATTIHKIKSQEGGFEAEYSRLPNGFTALYGDSQRPENEGKNKFRGYYPYDHNRVRLSLLSDAPGSDYINASLMHSYNQKKTYIASQAPNRKTVGDFWRMIWEQQCGRVIMLTGLVEDMKTKCFQYWPDKDDLQTDQYKVEVDASDTRANYTVRYLKLTSKQTGDCRSVVQYHFTSWPDHGVPDTLALVHFICMIRQTDTQADGPLVVHCSAGIGRTGTYIAVDSLLDQAREEGVIEVLGYVSVMRGQRKNMIQTKEQYECVFHCLLEMTTFGNTSMDVENFITSYSSRGMDSMVGRKTLRELTQMMIAENRSENIGQNRVWVDGNGNFMIRAGPTLRNAKGYLMAVVPPPGLEKLLWKLVEENNVHNIIVISQLQKDLIGGEGSRNKCGAVTLTTTGQTNLDSDLTMTTLELQNMNSKDTQNIKLFKLNGFPTLDSMSSCLLNNVHLQHLSGEITPVVIVHSETDRQCAVSLSIMGNILSGIMEDHRVDVIGHVRKFLKCYSDLTFSEQEIQKFLDFAKASIQMTTPSNTYANL